MVRRDNAPDRNFCAEKWYDDKSLAYVPQATALNDEAFVAPSFLTLKLIREMKKKNTYFFPWFLTLLVAYLNSTTTSTFIYLWTQDKYVCWVSFLKAIICHFLLSVLCVLHTVFYSSFNYFFLFCVERIFLWFCKHVSLEQVFTHSPDSAGVFLMCFHYLLCNIQSKALISSIAVWQREYLSVTLYDGWQIKGKNKAS